MKVCLDISAALNQTAGIGRYVREIALALNRMDEIDLQLFSNRGGKSQSPDELEKLKQSRTLLNNKLWRAAAYFGWVPEALKTAEKDFDLFHGPDVVTTNLSKPMVITVHDLSMFVYPGHVTRLNRAYLRRALPVMIRRAQKIIAVSKSTKNDLMKILDVPESRICVVLSGVDHQKFLPRDKDVSQKKMEAELEISTPYLLAVGTLEPRKNLSALLYAYSKTNRNIPKLVLTGSLGWGAGKVLDLIAQLELKDRVHLTGFVPDELLPELYSGADLFVFPSLFEGFGLPVLEAMACGTPVITSSSSSLPEAAGDAAIMIDPNNPDGIKQAIELVMSSSDLGSDMKNKGIIHAKNFSWDKTARETVKVYEQVISD